LRGIKNKSACREKINYALNYDQDSGFISIPIFEVKSTPSTMYKLWEKYPDKIRVIQTIAHPLEKAQRSYWPNEEI